MGVAFLAEWASPYEWAAMYRSLGLQVVPGRAGEKRPLIDWLEFRNALVPSAQFDRWFDPKVGEHRMLRAMGLLTGACSKALADPETTEGLFLVDLDVKDTANGLEWWRTFVEVHLGGIEPETWMARSGGGGLHYYFLAPKGWVPPTNKFPMVGVDVRGQGGYVVAAPSMHPNGKIYEWVEGFEPWSIPIAMAPPELVAEVDKLRAEHGAHDGAGRVERTLDPATAKSPFGKDIDGREEKLANLAWALVVDLRRESPIPPTLEVMEAEILAAFDRYLLTTKSRLEPRPGLSQADLLELEGRGLTALRVKVDYAKAQWDTKVAEAALVPKPEDPNANTWGAGLAAHLSGEFSGNSTLGDGLFEVLSMADLAKTPDVTWLVKDALVRGGLGLLFGAPGSLKTFVALDLALALAYETGSWLGYDAPGGHVLYIASEGASGLYKRILAWRRKRGVTGDSERFHLIREPMSFMRAPDIERLANTIAAHGERHGTPALIVVDTVSRVLPGADENLQKDMTVFVASCDRLRQQFGAAVLGVHHTNKAGDMRGSSVLDGAADSVFRIERSDGEQSGTLICEKQKDAEDGWRRGFLAVEESWTTDGHIEVSTSLVIDWTVAEPNARTSWPPRAVLKAMQWFIHAAFEKGEPLSMAAQTKHAGRYAPVKLGAKFELKPKVMFDVLQTWLDNGVIEVTTTSMHSKLRGLEVVKWLD